MKKIGKIFCILLLVSLVVVGCSAFDLIQGKRVKPSNTIISETWQVSGFNGIDMGTYGKVVLRQGDVETMIVSGSDNLVRLVETHIQDGILSIAAKEEFFLTSFTEENMLTFTIVAKEIETIIISGISEFEVESLITPRLLVSVSGGGNVIINQLATDDLRVVLSGMGTVQLAGAAKQAMIELSGTGSVDSPDLKIHSARVTLSGIGGANLWVTDQLTGDINGTGGVSYFGNPQTNVQTRGLGEFKSLGTK